MFLRGGLWMMEDPMSSVQGAIWVDDAKCPRAILGSTFHLAFGKILINLYRPWQFCQVYMEYAGLLDLLESITLTFYC